MIVKQVDRDGNVELRECHTVLVKELNNELRVKLYDGDTMGSDTGRGECVGSWVLMYGQDVYIMENGGTVDHYKAPGA